MLVTILSLILTQALPLDTKKDPAKIAFGSCYGITTYKNPEIFRTIRSKSDLYIWLGDAIYADDSLHPSEFTTSSFEDWESEFGDLKSSEGYKELLESTMVIGVWDDHDYGLNNADSTFPHKDIASKYYLDFIDEPLGSPRRLQKGIYTSYAFNRLKIILLDNRYFRTEQDDLGTEQWNWLEQELKGDFDLFVIGIGLKTHIEKDIWERYDTLSPKTFKRLGNLIRKIGGKTIIISGDVHYGEIILNPCFDYPIIEVSSSGLSHTENTGLGPFVYYYLSFFVPMSFNLGPRVWKSYHFGMIDIDWNSGHLNIGLYSTSGETLTSYSISLDTLSRKKHPTAICYESKDGRWNHHVLSMHLVFALPILLPILALVTFFRKYSKSW